MDSPIRLFLGPDGASYQGYRLYFGNAQRKIPNIIEFVSGYLRRSYQEGDYVLFLMTKGTKRIEVPSREKIEVLVKQFINDIEFKHFVEVYPLYCSSLLRIPWQKITKIQIG